MQQWGVELWDQFEPILALNRKVSLLIFIFQSEATLKVTSSVRPSVSQSAMLWRRNFIYLAAIQDRLLIFCEDSLNQFTLSYCLPVMLQNIRIKKYVGKVL